MQTIKTFVVVGLLLAVCYGAFVALNAPDVSIPQELEQWANSTNENALKEFEIPALSMPEPFAANGNSPQAAETALTALDSLPSFPAIDSTMPSVESPSHRGSSSSTSLPTLTTPGTASLLPSSGATLTSNQSGLNSATPPIPANPAESNLPTEANPSDVRGAENIAGPSIAFNANQPASNLAIDELISAGGGVSQTPVFNSTEINSGSFPVDPNGVSQDVDRPEERGLLASRANAASEVETASDDGNSQSLPAFSVARAQAMDMAQSGKLTEALELMSQYYESPELGYAEHTDLVDMLDALAREVIYSDRPLLSPKYTVSAQDTLTSLAEKHRINAELLAAVNKMGESQALIASTEIKLMDGPFRAQISLSRGELTLFLRKLYAGRFPISVSQQNKPPLGTYEVVDRRRDRTFYGANSVIPAGAPTNPYGGYWLSLGGNLSIHGSPEQVTSDLENAGCISLAPLDAADVYRILGKGASVEVRP